MLPCGLCVQEAQERVLSGGSHLGSHTRPLGRLLSVGLDCWGQLTHVFTHGFAWYPMLEMVQEQGKVLSLHISFIISLI